MIITSKIPNQNILYLPILNEMLDIQENIQKLKVVNNQKEYTLNDICFQPTGPFIYLKFFLI